MKQKVKKMLSYLFMTALVLGLMPGMSLLAHASNPYASLKNTTTVVKFDNKDWYLIDYDESTVTLLSKECVAASQFRTVANDNNYSGSAVEEVVNNWYTDNISSASKIAVNGNGMFLLTTQQAQAITNVEVRKCPQYPGTELNIWWLCSPDSTMYIMVAFVRGSDGNVYGGGANVRKVLGVRPALKLNLSAVNFSSDTNTFTETMSTSHSVSITAGSNMTKTSDSGEESQIRLPGAMTNVVYTADEGYYFPTDYRVTSVNGISVIRNSYTQITVYGTPTAYSLITLPSPTRKTKPAVPSTPFAMSCTTEANNDGMLIGVATEMEYKKSDADDWIAGTGNDITGLSPGSYYVRIKATDTTFASDIQELTIDWVGNPLASIKNTTTVVKFDNKDWYLADYSGSTVTLLSKECVAASQFRTVANDNKYSGSAVEEVVNNWYTDNISSASKIAVNGNGMFLLTTEQAQAITNVEVRKCPQYPESNINAWWLCSPGGDFNNAAYVLGNGYVYSDGCDVDVYLGVRPALKLNLSSVVYSSDTKTFSMKVDVNDVILNKASTTLDVGGTETLTATVAPVKASDKSMIWSSSDRNVVRVSETGVVTAVSPGTAIITVTATNGTNNTSDDKAATCTVTVNKFNSVVIKAPQAKKLTYNGSAQELVTAGKTAEGTMQYALGTETAATTLYTIYIPTATDVGTYYVWYIAVGGANYNNSEPACIKVTIVEKTSSSDNAGSGNSQGNNSNNNEDQSSNNNSEGQSNDNNDESQNSSNNSANQTSDSNADKKADDSNNSDNGSSDNNEVTSNQSEDGTKVHSSDSDKKKTTEVVDKKQKNAKLSKPKAGKKSFTITWKKQTAKGIAGYELQYSTDKNFKKDVKKVTINKTKTTSKTIKKLKSKKTYYVRIRTFKKVNKAKVYSKWSGKKSVKVK